jgi:hypothetical protein
MKLGLKCCFNRLLVVKLGVSLCLLLLMDISLWFSQSTWGGQFIVFHGTIRYYKDLDTIDFDQYIRLYGSQNNLSDENIYNIWFNYLICLKFF